jgi:hypothetical protein
VSLCSDSASASCNRGKHGLHHSESDLQEPCKTAGFPGDISGPDNLTTELVTLVGGAGQACTATLSDGPTIMTSSLTASFSGIGQERIVPIPADPASAGAVAQVRVPTATPVATSRNTRPFDAGSQGPFRVQKAAPLCPQVSALVPECSRARAAWSHQPIVTVELPCHPSGGLGSTQSSAKTYRSSNCHWAGSGPQLPSTTQIVIGAYVAARIIAGAGALQTDWLGAHAW